LIEGKYPRYEGIIPAQSQYSISFNRAELTGALKRIQLILSDSGHPVVIELGNRITLKASTDNDESQEEIGGTYSADSGTRIPFNAAYLLDPLPRLESEEVVLNFSGNSTAATLSDHADFLYVLMPMRM